MWVFGCPWVFAGEEEGCGPVGVGDWARADGGERPGLVFGGKGVELSLRLLQVVFMFR